MKSNKAGGMAAKKKQKEAPAEAGKMGTDKPLGKGDHLFLVDGSGYIFRAYHALPPLTRKSDGLPEMCIRDSTHVFNPAWTPHVRIHEVWQLMTNTGLAGLVLWMIWVKGEVIRGAAIGLFITGGFLAAFLIRDTYGGSMKYLDGSEKTVAGLNIGVLGFSVVFVCLLAAILLEKRRPA